MKKKLRYKAGLLLLVLSIIFTPIRTFATETEEKKITVVSPSMAAMQGQNEYQEMYRYTYEYLDMIANYADWEVEIIYAESEDLNQALVECMEMVQNHQADFTGGVLKNEALEQMLLYPDNSYGTVHTVLLTQQNNPYLHENNLNTQMQLRIATIENATQRNEETKEYLDAKDINYIFIPCDTDEKQMSLVKSGQADAMVGVDAAPVEGMKQLAAYAQRDMYLVSAKGNESLIQELDNAISMVNQVLPNFQPNLFEKIFTIPQDAFKLTDAQKEYTQNRKPIRVLFNIDAPPFQFKDKNGEIKGVFIDVLDRVSTLTGLKFEYLEPKDGLSVKEMIDGGYCDMVLSMPITGDWVSYYNILHSTAVVDSGYIKICNKNACDKSQKDTVLALPVGTLVKPDFEPKETVYFANAKECMDAVNDGKADCSILNELSFSYYHTQQPYRNIKIQPLNDIGIAYGFAYVKPLDIELATIVNAAIESLLRTDIYSDMADIMSDGAQSTLWGMYVWNPVRMSIIGVSGLLLLFITLFFVTSYVLIRRKNRQLIKASAAKSEFLSHVSHEIRTPLNSILGFSNLAMSESSGEVKTEYLQNIQASGQYLLGIINDILDMSKAEHNRIEFVNEQVHMNSVIENVQVLLKEPAQKRNVQLAFLQEFPDDLQILADKQRIQQIFINLLSNAIKYSHYNGKVECVTNVKTAENGQTVCEITVTDHGVGMSDEFLKEIFKPFTQEKNQYTTALNSCGLGLSIVHKIVTALSGSIQVESKLGEGSVFTVVLPIEVVEADKVQQTQKTTQEFEFYGANILLCEDHALNAKLLKKLLENKGAVLTVAENGQIGLEQYLMYPSGHFKAVLMDIHMPVMNGTEAAQAIRSSKRIDSDSIPIIAVTANSVAEGLSELKQYGMNAYVPKPIDPKTLYQTLQRHMQ